MALITVVITLMVVAILLWAFDTYVPETARTAIVKKVVIALVVIAVIVWLLQISGLLSGVQSVPFPHR